MGSGTATLRALVREYVFVSLFRACAESLASENASRLAAMQRADKNIDELLGKLNTAFQRVARAASTWSCSTWSPDTKRWHRKIVAGEVEDAAGAGRSDHPRGLSARSTP